MTEPVSVALASEDLGEARVRGPYEIVITTDASPLAVASVTLPPETNLARAKQTAREVLAQHAPGASAAVHHIAPDAKPFEEGEVKFRAQLHADRTIHVAH